MFNVITKLIGKQRINRNEVIDLETGEIIEKTTEQSIQQAAGIQYAISNADVPLYRQNVDVKESLRVTITGRFDMKREPIVSRLNEMGISVGNLTGKTTLLIIGAWGREVGDDGVSNKYLKAIEHGVKMIKLNTADEIFAYFSTSH